MDKDSPIIINMLKVQPSYLAVYKEFQFPNGRKYSSDYSKYDRIKEISDWIKSEAESIMPTKKLPDSNAHNGLISQKAARKIKNSIDWLLCVARPKHFYSSYYNSNFTFKLSFITLTLSSTQIHSDNVIKETLLNQFLIEARKKWNVDKYLWRAETQVNGNIHFHIVTDRFIPHSELRDVWNRIQNKLGYVDRYREEMRSFHKGGFRVRQELLNKWSYKNQLRAYRTGSRKDWNSPNSTDIHSIWKVKNLSAYLSKYCTKNDNCRAVEGRLWGLSQSLTAMRGFAIPISNEITEELSLIGASDKSRLFESDYFSVFFVNVNDWCFITQGLLLACFKKYVDLHRSD